MDDIKTILSEDRPVSEIVTDLKNKSVSVPAWDELLKSYDAAKHDVMDKAKRPDKIVKGKPVQEAARIYFSLEKLAVKRMAEFMFSIPVKRVYSNIEKDTEKQKIVKAIEAIYKHARVNYGNIKRSRALFASCEVCTLWYTVEKKNNLYGFDSKWKLKCASYSPMDGYSLYPLFDEYGDMLAMSFEYKKKVLDKEITYFETYTDDKHYKWSTEGEGGYKEELNENIELGKIPVIYAHKSSPIYEDLSHIRNELEWVVSRNSDVIAYNSAPVLKVAGKLDGGEDKGNERRVYRVEANGDVSYVSWNQAIEAVKYQVDTLLKFFFMQLQLPDISFENMKSLGSIGYDARQTLLTDAHLKVGDEQDVFIEYFEREANIIKEFLKKMNVKWASKIDEIDIEHEITPFIQNDEKADIEKRQLANGGKPIESHLESIAKFGQSDNPDETLRQIQEEEAASAKSNSIMSVFNDNQ